MAGPIPEENNFCCRYLRAVIITVANKFINQCLPSCHQEWGPAPSSTEQGKNGGVYEDGGSALEQRT